MHVFRSGFSLNELANHQANGGYSSSGYGGSGMNTPTLPMNAYAGYAEYSSVFPGGLLSAGPGVALGALGMTDNAENGVGRKMGFNPGCPSARRQAMPMVPPKTLTAQLT